MGKHRRPSLFRRIFPKRNKWLGTTKTAQNITDRDDRREPESKVHIIPSHLEWFIPGDYCPN